MRINTTRFGAVEIQEADIIRFPDGILGFSNLSSFVLLDDPNDEIFAWLQSCESPEVAFPTLEPAILDPKYKVSLTKSDNEALNLKPEQRPMVFCIVTIPQDPRDMTANKKAPIVINVQERIAKQCVLQDVSLAIREPIFKLLKQRVVQPMTDKPVTKVSDQNMVVRLPENPGATLTE
jgi:flagellar assembly factor FliW